MQKAKTIVCLCIDEVYVEVVSLVLWIMVEFIRQSMDGHMHTTTLVLCMQFAYNKTSGYLTRLTAFTTIYLSKPRHRCTIPVRLNK